MAQFLIRIVNHFASEIITKRLANSRAFQQFAMKTHLKVEQTKKMAENPEEAAKLMRGAGEMAKAEAESVATSFERFKAALKEEVSQGTGAGAGGAAARSKRPKDPAASAVPKGRRTGASGGGLNSDIAARVQRRRR
ncbi:unnamed protein product [Scytosiphon promiscuus]